MTTELCSTCHLEPAKYKCPSCGVRSCSLTCVKKHKSENNCSGEIDPTKYVKKEELSEANVSRDYNFFLNLHRKIDLGKNDAKSTKPLSAAANAMKRPYNQVKNGDNKRPHNRSVVYTNNFESTNTSLRRGVKVKFVPKGMSRSNMNKSGFDKKKNCMSWTVEWLLIDTDLNQVLHRAISYKCNESSKLIKCFPMKNFLRFMNAQKGKSDTQEFDITAVSEAGGEVDSPKFFFYLKDFTNSTVSQIHSLDSSQVLADLLRDKTVLEFPTIYVSLKDEIPGMVVVGDGSDSDSSSSSSDSDSTSQSSASESEGEEIDKNADGDNSDDDEPPAESSAKQTAAEETLS